MNQPRMRVYTSRGRTPLWLLLAVVAPLGLVFLTSLLLALAIAGMVALAVAALPPFWKRPRTDSSNTIELDASQYHRIESGSPRDEQ